MRQIVRDGNVPAVWRYCDVAGIDAGTDFGDDLEIPQVVLRHPAVARSEKHETAVLGELRAAMQRKPRHKTVNRFELVAVEHRHVVIPPFDDDEEVHRIGIEHGLGRQRRRVDVLDARRADVGFAPFRRRNDRRVDQCAERRDLVRVQRCAERRHLGRDATLADDLHRLFLAQARKILRQQRRPATAEAVGAMTGGAVLLVMTARHVAVGSAHRRIESDEGRRKQQGGGEKTG